VLLCGYPPFWAQQQTVLFRMIRQGKFTFDSPYWDPISHEAKQLIRGCLTVDVAKRFSMQQVRAHAWVAGTAPTGDITPALGQLKLFNARRKLRGHMMAVIAANRLHDFADLAKDLSAKNQLKGGKA